MVEKRLAALNEIRQLAEMQKSEMSKLQQEAQKAAETASMQQEEISRKNSELLMMIESFEEQDEEEIKGADRGRTLTKKILSLRTTWRRAGLARWQ